MTDPRIAPKRCDKCGHVLGAEQRPLTAIQARVLKLISERIAGDGCAPTFAAIAAAFNWKSVGTVAIHVEALERKGYIRRDPNVARGITVLVSFDEVGAVPVETKHA